MTPLPSNSRPRNRRTPMAEINVTPMVDVMLVLLIIFMVTAPLLVAGVSFSKSKILSACFIPSKIKISFNK